MYKKENEQMENNSEFILYHTEGGDLRLEVRLENESVWLSQAQMVELFQKTKSTISEHIKNVFEEGELTSSAAVVRNFRTTAADGKTYETTFYNLDVIISVGYRVKSHRGTQFRIWATQRLKEYIVKGFALDDRRFKNAGQMNYFDELLNRIRDIRSSEKVFYQKIKDIYTTSIDYEPNSETTRRFFQVVQNKLLWASVGQTAPEIIYNRVNANLPHIGLTNWKNESDGKIRKADMSVSKNFLKEDEIQTLNLLVEQYLAFAELQASQRKPMYMRDWIEKLDSILTLNGRELLTHAGNISRELAEGKAQAEYEKFKAAQRLKEKEESDAELQNDISTLESEVKKIKPTTKAKKK